MFVKFEFAMREWKDQSWDELQKTIVDYADHNFPMSLLMRQGNHSYDQKTGASEFFQSSSYYVNRDIDDLVNMLCIEKAKSGEDLLRGRVFADVGRDGVVRRFSAQLDDQRIA